ncbi:MAG: SIS domain-containing protein [Fimbriimonadales bacterium]|jgi:glucosamine--fructose-6-phosphate aminotransferase (isomerizing)|nr:SIS domain-containing protein [Fimbriimonadales bacterium]
MSAYRMHAEIHEQPEVLRRIAVSEWHAVQEVARAVRQHGVRYVILAARGTSDHAAQYFKYLFEIENGIPCGLAAPSVVTLYRARLNLQGALVVGISQSGQAPDVIEYLNHARAQGALTLAITNDPKSPLAQVAELALELHAGEERAVAATKTYTATLSVIYLLSEALKDNASAPESLATTAEQVQQTLALDATIEAVVDRYRYMRECVALARGINQCTAMETALKLIETCYVLCKPYSVADFMHGPFALIEPGFPCLLFAPDGATYPTVLESARKLREGGAETITFAHQPEILGLARTPIEVPVAVPETVSPIVYAVLGQLFAYHLALARDLNPDQPRGLQKVTRTL